MQLLVTVGQFGDDSPITGNRSVVNPRVMGEFKFRRFVEDQKANKKLEYHSGRFGLSYGEAAFPLVFFANGMSSSRPVRPFSHPLTTFRHNRYPQCRNNGFFLP